jgi:hypothetical protein
MGPSSPFAAVVSISRSELVFASAEGDIGGSYYYVITSKCLPK